MTGIPGVMRVVAVAFFLLGVLLFLAPTNTDVTPRAMPEAAPVAAMAMERRAAADSLAEDIILYNLFTPSRTAPTRRYAGPSVAAAGMTDSNGETSSPSVGFMPVLIGTAVSERPGETRALLQLIASDPTPRLYGVGDRAGG